MTGDARKRRAPSFPGLGREADVDDGGVDGATVHLVFHAACSLVGGSGLGRQKELTWEEDSG
jgi:hypothetical protein